MKRITTSFWLGRSFTVTLPGTTVTSLPLPNASPAPPLRTIEMLPSVAGSIFTPGLNRSVICWGASVSVCAVPPVW